MDLTTLHLHPADAPCDETCRPVTDAAQARDNAQCRDDWYVLPGRGRTVFGPASEPSARAHLALLLAEGDRPQLLHCMEDYQS